MTQTLDSVTAVTTLERAAAARPRPGRELRIDQAHRHQWRRLLRRRRRASLREPDCGDEPRPHAVHGADSVLAHLRLRVDGDAAASGVGAVRRVPHDVRHRAGGGLPLRRGTAARNPVRDPHPARAAPPGIGEEHEEHAARARAGFSSSREADISRFVRMALEKEGMTVSEAKSAEEARIISPAASPNSSSSISACPTGIR